MTTFTVEPIPGWYTSEDTSLVGRVVRQHFQKWRINASSRVDPYVAQQQLGLQEGISGFAKHPADPYTRVRRLHTSQDEGKASPWVYICDVEYSMETAAPGQQNREEDNPLDDQPEIDVDGETILYPMFKDRNDVLIANKAKQPLTGVEEERAIEVMTITRNEATRNASRDRAFRNAINQNTWAGAPAGTVKVRTIRATRQFRNGILFWKYLYVLAYNPKGWQPKVLNGGTKQLVPPPTGDVKLLVDCVDDHNVPVTDPVPLDNDGKQIPSASLPDAAIYLTFDTLIERDIAALGLPTA